jgi:tripartite-type tricarboxylate transporter receptor subunit TctC
MTQHHAPKAGRRSILIASACLPTLPSIARASSGYPTRPIKFIVSFGPGTATDQVARLIAPELSRLTGQSVVVENRGGASGFIACEAVAKSPPDGYTLLVTTGTTHAANPSLFKKLPYDPVKDFVPITSASNNAFILVTGNGFPANNVQELAALARSSPGKVSFASANAPSRIGGEMFKMMAKVEMTHVPYKSAPQALTDLSSGIVGVFWCDLRTAVPLVQAGKIKALAVTSEKRLAVTPNVPTMIEQGFKDYLLANWVGLYLPAGAPADIAVRLNKLVHEAVRAKESAHTATGGTVYLTSNEEFAKLQARDTAMWASVTRAAGMIPQ